MKTKNVLLIAANIPQLYVAIMLIEALQKKGASFQFVVATREKYEDELAGLEAVMRVDPLPWQSPLLTDQLDGVLFVGHSFFLQEEELKWAARQTCPRYWVNAHFEQEDLESKEKIELYKSAFDAIHVDFPEDSERLENVGLDKETLFISGNLKYDCALASHKQLYAASDILRSEALTDKIKLVAGSVVAGEETITILDTFNTLQDSFEGLLLVIAPRSMEQIGDVCEATRERQLNYAKSSDPTSWGPATEVLVVDQMGLLKGLYAFAHVAIIGRSLFPEPGGGSNLLEPASQQAPIVVGPFMKSFEQDLLHFKENDAIIQLSEPTHLHTALHFLISYPDKAKAMANRAMDVVTEHLGAINKTADLISNRLLR